MRQAEEESRVEWSPIGVEAPYTANSAENAGDGIAARGVAKWEMLRDSYELPVVTGSMKP